MRSLTRFSLALVVMALLTMELGVDAAQADETSPLTVRLTAEGAEQRGVVPDGVCSARVRAVGGGGGANWASNGSDDSQRGGAGADISLVIPVVPTQSFYGTVGGGGAGTADGSANPGGAGGGGAGGAGLEHTGAGGGGRTHLEIAGTLVVVAGGGGGAGSGHWADGGHGGDAGIPLEPGLVAIGSDGRNGRDVVDEFVETDGGEGGQIDRDGHGAIHPGEAERSGTNGEDGRGGRGGTDDAYDGGGGGGAGYTGGGGGVATVRDGGGPPSHGVAAIGGSGGGGGSSYVNAVGVDADRSSPRLGETGIGTTFGAAAIRVGNGGVGLLDVGFVPCDNDVRSSLTLLDAQTTPLGTSRSWELALTNIGPDPMTRGDVLRVAVPPQLIGTAIESITIVGGVDSGLTRGPMTCSVGIGQLAPAALRCSRRFAAPEAVESPFGGRRGLDSEESLRIRFSEVDEQDGIEFVSEALSDPTRNDDGTYSLDWQIVVHNTSDLPSTSIVLPDDLSTSLGVTADTTIISDSCTGVLESGASCAVRYGAVVQLAVNE